MSLSAGPPEKEEFFYKVRDDSNKRIHHNLKGKARKDYRNVTEDWENASVSIVRIAYESKLIPNMMNIIFKHSNGILILGGKSIIPRSGS